VAGGRWVGVIGRRHRRTAGMLHAAANRRGAGLDIVVLDVGDATPQETVTMLADLPAERRPLGLLLDDRWQEAAAGRCDTLTGGAEALGLADAVRIGADGSWQGHHLLAGAAEAALAGTWPAGAAAPGHAVIAGSGATALAAALAAVRRGVTSIGFVATAADDLVAALEEARESWLADVAWRVAAVDGDPGLEFPEQGGVWVEASDGPVAAGRWLPDAAGRAPCLLLSLVDAGAPPPLGFLHVDASTPLVMAAGLAVAWYLGPPVPWDLLRAAVADGSAT
jgi:hypothetical protein